MPDLQPTFTGVAKDPDSQMAVHDIFRNVAKSGCAQRVAVRQGDAFLTYEQLERRANHFAHMLRQKGVAEHDIVALSMPRSIEMIVAMMGVLKAGAAYLPLESANPVARNQLYLDEAKVQVIVSASPCDALLGQGRLNLLTSEEGLFTGECDAAPRVSVNKDALAYVMFTSGSTGKPKGVLVPHRGITRLVINSNFIDIQQTDKFLQFSPTSFDASTFEIWAPLLNGAELVLYQSEVFDPNTFKQDIHTHQVTVLWLTAALFHLIVDQFIDAISPLRVLLAGGDVLNVTYCNKVLEHIDGLTLINGYGPTENTTFTCCHPMTIDNRPARSVPIGLPISGTQVYVLDDALLPVAPGEVGELVAGGEGVALGYLNDAHSEAFIRLPDMDDGLLYRTGDLVRCQSDGCYEFVGRRNNLVKVRGYRVCLEEVRLGLMELPGIRDATVSLVSEKSGGQLLVASLSATGDFDGSSADVRRAVAAKFPGYMVPDKISISNELPINRNGKIDSKNVNYTT